MTNKEAVNWLINLIADIEKSEHHDLWHYEQALDEIKEMLEGKDTNVPSNNILRHPSCKNRTSIGNCDPVGGFCSSVPKDICAKYYVTDTDVGDTISRRAAIEAIRSSTKKYTGFMEMEMYTDDDAVEAIIKLPPSQPEQPSEIQDILDYLDTVLHPIISPEHWNVYSELHDMISCLPSAQPKSYKEKLKEIADALSEKFAYMNTCLNERDIILGYLDVKRPSEIHCNTDCTNIKCESHYRYKKTPSAQPELIRCKDCKYNGECSIQFVANADDKFFCGAGER